MSRGKGVLVFVGLGLHDESGVSMKGMQEMRGADLLFSESYTSRLSEGALDRLEKSVGKRIVRLSRTEVEDGEKILAECAQKSVALLVPGDPMTATTHVDLRIRAMRLGIETKIVHGASVLTAVPGILGLQSYKFGRTTTIPFPQEGYSPTSPLEVICENHSRGLHTLVLLDIHEDEDLYMSAGQGLQSLLDMESRAKKGLVSNDLLVCVVARAGADDCVARAGTLGELLHESFGPPLHAIVVPGKLHFMEEESLTLLGPFSKKD